MFTNISLFAQAYNLISFYLKMNGLISSNSLFYLHNDLWAEIDEYKEEYKKVIAQRESMRIPFQHQSPQVQYRRDVVNYMKKFASEKKMSQCCLHLAVYLLDVFMDNHAIDFDKIILVANVCLVLGAKMEEVNGSILKIAEINAAINNVYNPKDYKALEVLILQFFDWYVMFPTAATYIHYYMQAIVTKKEMDFLENILQETSRGVIFELHNKMRIYLDKILDDVHFMQLYPPSKLAAAVIAAARLRLGLQSWTMELSIFTEFSMQDIEDCLKNLLRLDPIQCKKCNQKIHHRH